MICSSLIAEAPSIPPRLPEDRMMIDPAKSLNAIAGLPDDPAPYESGLPGRHRQALATPLGDLDGYQIAMLIGQQSELDILARFVMDIVRRDPLARIEHEDCFELLFGRIDGEFWRQRPALRAEALALIADTEHQLPDRLLDIAIAFVGKPIEPVQDETA